MTKRLEGKVALITGGGSGIGEATALLFAKEGARIAVADVDEKGAMQTVTAIRGQGGEAVFIHCDVSRELEVQGMVNDVISAFSQLDIAVNNAGIVGSARDVPNTGSSEWDKVIAVNLTGVFLCMKYEIPQMLQKESGSIINMASIAGLGGYSSAPYTSSKHGVVGLTKVSAIECKDKGVRVNAICPGVIDTPLLRAGLQQRARAQGLEFNSDEDLMKSLSGRIGKRIGKPFHIANAALWLASDESEFVTGSTLLVDGGKLAGPDS